MTRFGLLLLFLASVRGDRRTQSYEDFTYFAERKKDTTKPVAGASPAIATSFSTLVVVEEYDYRQNLNNCTDGSTGYTSLVDLQTDMDTEVDRLADGGENLFKKYEFQVCPGTQLVVEEQPLRLSLDKMTLSCDATCTFLGGDRQLELVRGSQIKVKGFNFQGFAKQAILAQAPGSSMELQDAAFLSFQSNSVLSVKDATVKLSNAVVVDGTTEFSFFVNRGGRLELTGVQATALLSPESFVASRDGGETIAKKVGLYDVAIRQVFVASGEASSLVVEDAQLKKIEATFVFASQNGASMSLTSARVANAKREETSYDYPLSAGVVAMDAQVTAKKTEFIESVGFSAIYLSIDGGDMTVSESCLVGGEQCLFAAFTSEDSSLKAQSNYAAAFNSESSSCSDEFYRLARETPGSGCFDESDPTECMVLCETFADQQYCQAAP